MGRVWETWKERVASWSTKELELGEIGENYATMQLLLKADEAVETREKRATHCMGMQGTVRF